LIHRLGSSYRDRPLIDTLQTAATLMPVLGISRVTDITRLDRLGLPVSASIRPRSKGLRVTAGKGVTADEARASAVMEAIEHAVAEPQRTPWQARRMGWGRISDQFDDGVDLVDLIPRADLTVTRRTLVTTVECERLDRLEPIMLPAELVFYPYGNDPQRSFFVPTTTNGLASGNSVDEATLHGLLEVMERDAVAMNLVDDGSQWVEHAELPEPFRALASDWHRLGVDLSVRHVPNDFELPCFQAGLSEPASSDVNLAAGYGLHLDRGVALSRAICEAAQSRLSTIHGGRDDITGFYAKYTDQPTPTRLDREQLAIRTMFDTSRRIDFTDVPDHPRFDRSLKDALAEVLAIMRRAGLPSAFRHRFDASLGGLQVVKVIVPKSELVGHDARRIGRRLLERIMARA
jgi:ribosomal protein S12 methylthiotransferase accessory factor